MLIEANKYQERFWYEWKLNPRSTAYNLSYTFNIRGDLDIVHLTTVLYKLVQNLSELRMYFDHIENGIKIFIQEVSATQQIMDYFDLTKEQNQDRGLRLEYLLDEVKNYQFDLRTAYLFKFRLIKTGINNYYFSVTVHHIIADGIGLGYLLDLIELGYNNYPIYEEKLHTFQHDPSLVKETKKIDLAQAADYWQKKLEACPDQLILPRNSLTRLSESQVDFIYAKIDQRNLEKISVFCQQENITVFIFMMTCFAALLSRYLSQDKLVIKYAVNMRPKILRDRLVGCFTNNLPLRINLKKNVTFAQLLQNLSAERQEDRYYTDIPYNELIRELRRRGCLNVEKPYNVSLDQTLIKLRTLNFKNATTQIVVSTKSDSITDFGLAYELRNGGLYLRLHYLSEHFSAYSARLFLDNLIRVTELAVAHKDSSIYQFSLLMGDALVKYHQVSQGYVERFSSNTVLDYFQYAANARPEKIAVQDELAQLTYQALDQLSSNFAALLIRAGVAHGDVVAVFLQRSINLSLVLLGILKAGAAYMPLDIELPTARLDYMLANAAAKFVVVDDASEQGFKTQISLEQINVDKCRLDQNDDKALTVTPIAEDLAYIIYTSGSTGMPKGVKITHKALLNRLLWMQKTFAAKHDDVVLQKTPYSFDVSVWELFWPIMFGAKLFYAKSEGHKDPWYLAEVIQRQQISIIHFVPSMLKMFLLANINADRISGLKLVICSGESLTADLVTDFYKHYSSVKLFNLYGPTEAAIDVSYWDCGHVSQTDHYVPIGVPIDNVSLYVLDEYMQPVPPGVPGELFIGGICLATGYINNEKMTQEKFINSPFHPNALLYQTGDIVYWHEEGYYVYLQRKDFQVKLRGQRVELGEIEAVLNSHPQVNQSIVALHQPESGEALLVAYAATSADKNISSIELKEYLTQKLPGYMLPTNIILLQQMPLTSSGKIDRKALPKPIINLNQPPNRFEKPIGQVEQQLAKIWGELLKLDTINRNDNFFAVGGHSLHAIHMILRIEQQLNKRLTVTDIYTNPTIKTLAEVITVKKELIDRLSNFIESEFAPLSNQQQRLWLIEQMNGGKSAYAIFRIFRLNQPVDIKKLIKYINAFCTKHPILTIGFQVQAKDELIQVLGKHFLEIKYVEIKINTDQEIIRFAREVEAGKHELSNGPIFKTFILEHANSPIAVLFFFHHIVFDGASVSLFIKEISDYYQNEGINLDPEIVETTYFDYVEKQQTQRYQNRINKQLKYWLNKLNGKIEPLNLPFDFIRPKKKSFSGMTLIKLLSSEVYQKLKVYAAQQNTTIFTVLTAALYALLYRYTCQQDILLGTVMQNRPSIDYQKTIGFFANTVVLRNSVYGEASLNALLTEVKLTLREALANQEAPFNILVEKLGYAGILHQNPLFQVAIVWQGSVDNHGAFGEEIRFLPSTAKFDLAFYIHEHKNSLEFNVEFATDLFKQETISQLTNHYENIINALIYNDTICIDEIQLLTPKEKTSIKDFNNTERSWSKNARLHELVTNAISQYSEKPAVISYDKTLSYNELGLLSNQIANHLLGRKITSGDLVGILLPKGWKQVVACLGILKAGAAFIPLSLQDPAARIVTILNQASAKAIIGLEAIASEATTGLDQNVIKFNFDELLAQNATGMLKKLPVYSPGDLAYVIFTSGSTGTPKGVMISHESAVNTIYDINQKFSVNYQDCLFGISAFNFDLSIYDIFGLLAVGGTLLLPKDEESKDPSQWVKYFEAHAVTIWNSVPALMQLWMDYLERNTKNSVVLSQLRVALLSGDWIPLSLPQQIKRYCGDQVEMVSLGGATEASIWSIYYPIKRVSPQWKSIPYGKPLANQKFYVLNRAFKDNPVGVVGDLYIAGKGLAQGYLNDAEKTQKSFVIHPETKERLYRTGDLGKYLPEGAIEFCGRSDFQVKIRGFRIELGEIESCLSRHPQVDKVIIIPHGTGYACILLAFLVLKEQVEATKKNKVAEKLRNFLKAQLPDYMVPQELFILQNFPLTNNGKIDRKALVSYYENSLLIGDSLTTKQEIISEIELQLKKIWSDLLAVQNISRGSNFFNLGGHSLLVTKLSWAIFDHFAIDIAITELFEYATLAEQGQLVEKLLEVKNPFYETDEEVTAIEGSL